MSGVLNFSMPEALHFALDTEYTSHESPRLLSLALSPVNDRSAAVEGSELYVELDLTTPEGAFALSLCNPFVQAQVLPQLRKTGSVCPTWLEMGRAVTAWLQTQLKGQPCYVSYDWSTDMLLFEQLILSSEHPELLQRIWPSNLAILNEDPDAGAARELAWAESQRCLGVGRHHALADARALARAFQSQGK